MAERTITVSSPSVWRETVGVIRVVVHVAFWSAAIMLAPGAGAAAGEAATTQLAVDEVAFATLPAESQRLYRRALEGLTDAEDQRSRTGAWPTVEAEAARNVPPFGADPLDRAGYRWKLLREANLINYVGSASGAPTIAIVVLEPDRGMAPDPLAVIDEQHHRLRDGTLLHVSIWTGAKELAAPVSTPAFEDGWRRITMQ